MKKRDKKLVLTRETVRQLTTSEQEMAHLVEVAGGASCLPNASTHGNSGSLC